MPKTVNQKTKNAFLEAFGDHLKQLRTQKNLTQQELAGRCYANVNKIGRTERGEYDFKFSSLVVLAKGLDVSIPELLNFEYPENLFDTFWLDRESQPDNTADR